MAEVSVPAQVSLSGNPNFIEFKRKDQQQDIPVDISITVKGRGYIIITERPGENVITYQKIDISRFTIIEKESGIKHNFKGTSSISEAKGDTFYYGGTLNDPAPACDNLQVAENMKNSFLSNNFLGQKFDITLPLIDNGNGTYKRGNVIRIKSKGCGPEYAFRIEPEDKRLEKDFFSYTGDPEITSSSDSISEGHNPVEIQLEMYRDTGIFLGEDDKPDTGNMGSYVTTLSKIYSGTPLWFNINVLDNKKPAADFLNTQHTDDKSRWFDTGTIRDFRFIAKRFVNSKSKYENSVFYYSNVFYTVAGYDRTLEKNDLSAYVYDAAKNNVVKPLTTQPALFHVKGQKQFFNFIFSDPAHRQDMGTGEYHLYMTYRLYTQAKRFIAEVTTPYRQRKEFGMVNTYVLDIDQAIGKYKNVDMVEVYLCRDNNVQEKQISEPLCFRILPECLYKVNDFAFLNRLGGWSSFNFPGNEQTEFQSKPTTYYQTHTPGKGTSSEIESVYGKNITENFTVQTMPLTKEVCDWLRELSASKTVYELRTGRYIIIDDLNIKPNTKDELFRLDMKYHYSDSYNATIE